MSITYANSKKNRSYAVGINSEGSSIYSYHYLSALRDQLQIAGKN
jgi:hypothetical protein